MPVKDLIAFRIFIFKLHYSLLFLLLIDVVYYVAALFMDIIIPVSSFYSTVQAVEQGESFYPMVKSLTTITIKLFSTFLFYFSKDYHGYLHFSQGSRDRIMQDYLIFPKNKCVQLAFGTWDKLGGKNLLLSHEEMLVTLCCLLH